MKHLIAIALMLLALLSLSTHQANRLRSVAVASVTPPSKLLGSVTGIFRSKRVRRDNEEIARLCLENQRLRGQVDFLSRFDRYREQLAEQLDQLPFILSDPQQSWRVQGLEALVQLELKALPARVVYRSTASWHHCLWIGLGLEANDRVGSVVIAPDSPVVVGTAVVGVVDYVGRHRSRVRLLTDSSLHPAVRVVRHGPQDRELFQHIGAVQEALAARQDLFSSDEAASILHDNLEILKSHLDPACAGTYLAKGELSGVAAHHWRGGSQLLRGEGFNYDYGDAAGPARDLRTGHPSGSQPGPAVPLVQAGDLLVTSGLDGVFPQGLSVGRVVEVEPLREGAYAYNLLASPTAGNLNHLSQVFVLPPMSS